MPTTTSRLVPRPERRGMAMLAANRTTATTEPSAAPGHAPRLSTTRCAHARAMPNIIRRTRMRAQGVNGEPLKRRLAADAAHLLLRTAPAYCEPLQRAW